MSTRDAIIAAAADLMDEAGREAVTLRAVAHRVGVSHNAPYKHFHDKEALLAAVAARELRGRSELEQEAGVDALGDLKRMAQDYVRWAAQHPARFTLSFGSWSRDHPELSEAAHEARIRFVNTAAAAQAADKLPLGDPDRVSALVLALCHGAAQLAQSGHLSREGKGHAAPEDLVEDLFALYAQSTRTTPR